MIGLLGVIVALASAGMPAVQDERQEKVGDWTLTSIVDPITDEGRMIASLTADGSMLAIKCDEPGPNSVYVHWISKEYLGGNHERRRTMLRFDQDQPITENWSFDGRSAIQTNDREALAFARRLTTASRVVLRGSDFRGAEHTSLFAVTPADTLKALERVFETCRSGPLTVQP